MKSFKTNSQTIDQPHWFILLLITIWLFTPKFVFAEQTLILNTAFSYPLSTDEQTGFVDDIVRQALKEIGYNLKSVRLPAERALKNANTGVDDGDLLRVGGLQKIYPNLIQVPEPIIDIEFVVFSKDPNQKVSQWDDLKQYTVSIITGWKFLERNITNSAELTKVKNVDQLFSVLTKNRTDNIVYSRWSGLGYIKQNNIKNIHILHPPLAQKPMYIYLHKKHKDLVPKLAKALKEIKSNGNYKKSFDNILAPLTGK